MKIMAENSAEATLSVPSSSSSRGLLHKITKKPTRLLIKQEPPSDPVNLSPVVAQINCISLGTISAVKKPTFTIAAAPSPPEIVISSSSSATRPKFVLTPTDNLTPEIVTANFVFTPRSSFSSSASPAAPANSPTSARDVSSAAAILTTSSAADHQPVKRELKFRAAEAPSSSRRDTSYRLEDFKWIKTIGTGTFGRVVLCEHKANTSQTHPFYAMKMLRIADVFRLKQVEHIRDEKRILEQLNHPFIVRLFWSHHDSVNLYMLLEYAPGGELFSYLRSVGRFDCSTSMFYAAEIILALEYLHARNIVYRDLKPENLIFDRDGHVKITDFGFAKELTDRTWTLCGTPEYLAPEIIQSRGYNKAVDYWAYGILVYEMLAGHPPFFSDNPIEVYQRILDGKIRWPKHMDLVAKDLIRKLLVADRTKRLGNMKNGSEDIKAHRWFRSIDWESCLRREIQPPYVPEIKHPGDTSNFDDYSDAWMDDDEDDGEFSPAYQESLSVFDDFC